MACFRDSGTNLRYRNVASFTYRLPVRDQQRSNIFSSNRPMLLFQNMIWLTGCAGPVVDKGFEMYTSHVLESNLQLMIVPVALLTFSETANNVLLHRDSIWQSSEEGMQAPSRVRNCSNQMDSLRTTIIVHRHEFMLWIFSVDVALKKGSARHSKPFQLVWPRRRLMT